MLGRRWSSSGQRTSSAFPKWKEGPPNNPASRPKTAFFSVQEEDPAQQRPTSNCIRPLSGKVFIRRTIKRGWVAKSVNDPPPGSGVWDLEEEDDLSDTGSLDSFFDDDFDQDTKEEALGKFLSCNTLGVESKGHKPDWRAGELAIPEFHCPRCRDHWYGLSAFPCDEELARLIREGKWYVGKRNGFQNERLTDSQRERGKSDNIVNSHSTDSITLPDISSRRKGGFQIKKSDHHIDFLSPTAQNKKKKNRHISFKLGNEDEDGDNLKGESSTGLLDVRKSGRKGGSSPSSSSVNVSSDIRGRETAGDSKFGGGLGTSRESGDDTAKRNMESSSSASDLNSGSSATLLRETGRIQKGRRSDGDNDGNSKGVNKSRKGGNRLANKREESSLSKLGEDISKKDDNRKLGNGEGDGKGSINSRLNQSTHYGGSLNRQEGEGGVVRNTEQFTQGQSTDDKGSQRNRIAAGREEGRKDGRPTDSQTSSHRGSQISLHRGSQRWGGGEKTERELVQGKGYMRASSSSQSEWGDPTHARIWASNTASSSRVSLAPSNSGRHNNDEDTSEPILPPIIRQKTENPFASINLMDGFELTRAFRFSYY